MDVEQTTTTVQRQRHFREVHGRERRTVVGIFAQLTRYFQADILLRFLGRAADVRRQDHVVEFAQRRGKRIAVGRWLRREDVDARARQVLTLQRIRQGRDIDNRTARGVDQQ